MTEKQIIKLLRPVEDRFTISFGKDKTFKLKAKYGNLEVEYDDMHTETEKGIFNKLLALQFSQGYKAGVDVGQKIVNYEN